MIQARATRAGHHFSAMALGVAALLSSTALLAESPPPVLPETAVKPRPASCENAQVLRVIDGDTLVVAGAQGTEKLRISQISAPKRSQRSGPYALACLQNLAAGKPVSLCRDGRDRYGLALANLAVDGKDLASSLVEKGCAHPYFNYLEAGSPLPALHGHYWMNHDPLPVDTPEAAAPWVYRAASVPVPVLANGQTPIQVSSSTLAKPVNRLLDWAEFRFDALLQGGSGTQAVGTAGDGYRCYSSGQCLGLLDGAVVFHDGQQIRTLLPAADALRAAQADGY